jgi:hypothetical protein
MHKKNYILPLLFPSKTTTILTIVSIAMTFKFCTAPEDSSGDPMKGYSDLKMKNTIGLAVIGTDLTPSMGGTQILDTCYIRQICMSFLESSQSVHIAFGTIGNPSRKNLVQIEIQPQESLTNKSLAKQATIAKQNRTIEKNNIEKINNYILLCQERIEETRLDNDHSDINGFLEKAQLLCNETRFIGVEKVVFIQSDGQQFLGKRKTNVLYWPEWGDQTSVHLSDWRPEYLPTEFTFNQYESPQGFLFFLKK